MAYKIKLTKEKDGKEIVHVVNVDGSPFAWSYSIQGALMDALANALKERDALKKIVEDSSDLKAKLKKFLFQ